jgi:hypothetical protein
MKISRRSDRFFQRTGLTEARIGPRGRFAPGQNLSHSVPLASHQIASHEILVLDGEASPDHGSSRPLPYSPFEPR